MTEPHDRPTLDDVMETTEAAPHDRHEHGKGYDRPDDDELAHRTEEERVQLGIDAYDPDTVPEASD